MTGYRQRLGRLGAEPDAGPMYMSEARVIARSWTTTLGWYFARALGWPRTYVATPSTPEPPSTDRYRLPNFRLTVAQRRAHDQLWEHMIKQPHALVIGARHGTR